MIDVYILDNNGWTRLSTFRVPEHAFDLIHRYRAAGRLMGWFDHDTRRCYFDA